MAQYCSRDCKERAKRRRESTRSRAVSTPCLKCGTPCRAPVSGMCRACFLMPRGTPKACLHCGGHTQKPKFCSRRCYNDSRRVEAKATRAAAARIQRDCATCGSEFVPHRLGVQYCSIICRHRAGQERGRASGAPWAVDAYAHSGGWTPMKKATYQRRRALIQGATAPGELIVSSEVFARDGWVCGICGASVDKGLKHPDPMSVSLDHIVPVSKGGAHSMANVQCAHLFCNTSKGNRPARVRGV